jgi:hypothetical protein
MPCLKTNSSFVVEQTTASQYNDLTGCSGGSNAQGNYFWVDTAGDQLTSAIEQSDVDVILSGIVLLLVTAFGIRIVKSLLEKR